MTQDPTSLPGAADGQPGYAEAVSELDRILEELERDDVDVDVLGTRVARAAELISICRERIDAARFQVEQIVTGLPATTGEAQAAATTPPEDGGSNEVTAAYAEPDVDGAGA